MVKQETLILTYRDLCETSKSKKLNQINIFDFEINDTDVPKHPMIVYVDGENIKVIKNTYGIGIRGAESGVQYKKPETIEQFEEFNNNNLYDIIVGMTDMDWRISMETTEHVSSMQSCKTDYEVFKVILTDLMDEYAEKEMYDKCITLRDIYYRYSNILV